MPQDFSDISLMLIGCGKMGSALLSGWLKQGVPAGNVTVLDPMPSDWVKSLGVHINQRPISPPDVLVVAVKPQQMQAAMPDLSGYGGGATVVVSVAAGTLISKFEQVFGQGTPVVRAMPNTPASIGQGVTGLVANRQVNAGQMTMVTGLMQSVGKTVVLANEDQMHALTGISGSGPAYVFAMAEAMEAAGLANGLDPQTAKMLAIETICGAGMLLAQSDESAAQLRQNVTSPNGTTQAGLEVFNAAKTGIEPLVKTTVSKARDRSIELAKLP